MNHTARRNRLYPDQAYCMACINLNWNCMYFLKLIKFHFYLIQYFKMASKIYARLYLKKKIIFIKTTFGRDFLCLQLSVNVFTKFGSDGKKCRLFSKSKHTQTQKKNIKTHQKLVLYFSKTSNSQACVNFSDIKFLYKIILHREKN